MNDYVVAIILGVIEGLTEFIPVSSTAHLRIAQAWLDIPLDNEFWKMFSVVIQLGAILAVITYFSKQIQTLLRSKNKTIILSQSIPLEPLATKILLAFVITAVPSFLLSKIIDENLESLTVMGISLVIGGVFMVLIDTKFLSKSIKDINQISFRQASSIGAIQILSAVFPGVSRSMSTIVGGQIVGLSRSAALEFSFLLSIPTMFAATGYDLLKTWMNPESTALQSTHDWMVTLVGGTVSYFIALAVVAWLMNWVKKRGFVFFGLYRILIGAIVLSQLK